MTRKKASETARRIPSAKRLPTSMFLPGRGQHPVHQPGKLHACRDQTSRLPDDLSQKAYRDALHDPAVTLWANQLSGLLIA